MINKQNKKSHKRLGKKIFNPLAQARWPSSGYAPEFYTFENLKKSQFIDFLKNLNELEIFQCSLKIQISIS